MNETPLPFTQCYLCEEFLSATDNSGKGYPFTADNDEGDHAAQVICEPCTDDALKCEGCEAFSESLHEVYTSNSRYGGIRNVCFPCQMEDYYYCEGCDESFQYLHTNSDTQCADCYSCECYECGCDDCYPDGCDCDDCQYGGRSDYIHDYSYKPSPRFHDSDDNVSSIPTPNTPYLGLELEISIDERGEGAELLSEAAPTLIYCKEDSSVDGFELVTHPMTLQAATSLIPFSTLRQLRNEYSASAIRNGIHVHVSRNGFESDLHVYKWVKLFYRNADNMRRLARRSSNEWASFENGERNNHRKTARKVSDYSRTARYSAINLQNEKTFEVRIFQGSLLKHEILSTLELVHATVEYTRQLTAEDILKYDGWSWAQFIEWASYMPEYANLLRVNDEQNAAEPAASPGPVYVPTTPTPPTPPVSEPTYEQGRIVDCGQPDCDAQVCRLRRQTAAYTRTAQQEQAALREQLLGRTDRYSAEVTSDVLLTGINSVQGVTVDDLPTARRYMTADAFRRAGNLPAYATVNDPLTDTELPERISGQEYRLNSAIRDLVITQGYCRRYDRDEWVRPDIYDNELLLERSNA